MAISNRINPDNLNIHQFQEVPETRPELPFDVERDISPELRGKYLDVLKDIGLSMGTYCAVIADLRILWPNEQWGDGGYSDMQLLDQLKELVDGLEENRGADLSALLYYASDLVMTRPQIHIDPSIKVRIWEEAGKYIEQLKERKAYDDLISIVSVMKRFDPTRRITIAKEDMAVMRIKAERPGPSSVYRMKNLRYIDSNYRPELTTKQWDELRASIIPSSDITLAVALKVLAAHKVEITAPGIIDIQMYPSSNVNQSTPAMPETRKF